MKISGEHTLSECIIRDLSYLTGPFTCINSRYKINIYHIIDITQHNKIRWKEFSFIVLEEAATGNFETLFQNLLEDNGFVL